MAAIPVPISSSPGVKPQEGAGRLVNCFAEKTESGARFPVIWRRSAGLRFVADVNTANHIHTRGGILVGSTLLVVFNTRVWAFDSSFTATNLGALTGTDPVTCAKNNAGTPNIVAVSQSAGAFNLFTGGAPTAFADPDLPANPTSVSVLDGYFLFTFADGRIFASDLNAVTVSALSFNTEQTIGSVLRGVVYRGEFFAFGERGCGVYKDAGTTPFPLARLTEIEKGIAGTYAIAGWEPGWIKQLIWVGEDGVVYRLNGYTPQAISTPDVTRAIAAAIAAGGGSSLEATVHMQGNHAFWRLTYPGNWSWEFNATTSNWNERESYNLGYSRGSGSIWAFNYWVQGDRSTGKLFVVDDKYFYEDTSDPLIMQMDTGAIADFPARIAVPQADFDFTTGVGVSSGANPIQTDPQVQIAWSLDGGGSYGSYVNREIGGEGEYGKAVRVNRLGLTKGKGMRFRLRVSDPVHVAFLGGQTATEERAP